MTEADRALLTWLRVLAILVGAGASIGEAIRSWGVSRPAFTVVDDFLIGAFLIIAAVRAFRPGGPALLAAAFGFASGLLYGSFFMHLGAWDQPDPGNIPQHVLTALIGLAFGGSLLGLALTLRLVCRSNPR